MNFWTCYIALLIGVATTQGLASEAAMTQGKPRSDQAPFLVRDPSNRPQANGTIGSADGNTLPVGEKSHGIERVSREFLLKE